jgi:hypothetical protein
VERGEREGWDEVSGGERREGGLGGSLHEGEHKCPSKTFMLPKH